MQIYFLTSRFRNTWLYTCIHYFYNIFLGGLCYQGFLEAFLLLADKKFESNNTFDSFLALLEHCEKNLGENMKEKKLSARISGRGTMFPTLSKSEASQDDRLSAYKASGGRKKTNGSNYFLDYRNFSADSPSRTEPLYAKSKITRSKTNISRAGVRLKKLDHEGGSERGTARSKGGERSLPPE